MILELTEQEAEVLIKLLDIATKAGGLSVADASLYFFNKLKSQEPIVVQDKVKNVKKEN